VQGKGMGAALVMALAAAALRTSAERAGGEASPDYSPATTLRLVGRLLHRSVGMRDFVCCALALLEPGVSAPRLRLANAGQIPPLLCRAGSVEEIRPPGQALPLGVLAEPAFEEISLDLEPGDVVVFVSDGVPETPTRLDGRLGPEGRPWLTPPAGPGEYFGFERVAQSVGHWVARAEGAEGVLRGLWEDVSAWCGDDLDHDDATLVVLRVARQPGQEAIA
jgi:serine phosphatase RsbU (regulator of sigma subunit)